MKKIVLTLILLLALSLSIGIIQVYADNNINTIISSMNGTSSITSDDAGSHVAQTINDVIGLIQLAGTGISVVVVTMLGIKYMLASPSEKADTKKMIMPILIGCVLLFGAVNLVAAIADFSIVLDAG